MLRIRSCCNWYITFDCLLSRIYNLIMDSCLLIGLTRAIYELVWHGIKGPLRREATATTLGEIVVSILYSVISSTELFCSFFLFVVLCSTWSNIWKIMSHSIGRMSLTIYSSNIININ